MLNPYAFILAKSSSRVRQSNAFDRSINIIPHTPHWSICKRTVSMTLSRACWVLCLSLNPHIVFANLSSIKGAICLFKRRSNTFEKADSTLIGRELLFELLLPSLYTGGTSASFNGSDQGKCRMGPLCLQCLLPCWKKNLMSFLICGKE